MIREQLRVHDAAPVCDGAACVLLATRDVALRLRREGKPVVRVAGSSSATDSLALVDRKDPLVLSALAKANSRAFASARISVSDVDIYEPHDAFSIMTVLSLEASGFAQVGRGVALGDEIGRMARLPTSTMGGLKARGHPVGASGIYQLVEAFLQLTGNAGQAQVPNGPSVAVTQNLGGTGATATVHVLARE
jgi:acetyl-CoA C-acetyltransferase